MRPGLEPAPSGRRRCSGCGRCVAACPSRLYTLEPVGFRKLSVNIAPDKCTSCSRCSQECPLGILSDGSMTC